MTLLRISRSTSVIGRMLPVAALLVTLSACGKHEAPQASVGDTARAVSDAVPVNAARNPLCDAVTFAEVQAVIGGNVNKVDVIEDGSMASIDCIYLDTSDLYAGLTMRYFTADTLSSSGSQWPTASSYFAEWSRTGTAVTGVGDSAAWTELPAGLLVLSHDTVLQISASRLDFTNAEVRARIETLAREALRDRRS